MQTGIASGECQVGQNGPQQDEIVQKIQQLMYQDKAAAIAEVVNLIVIRLKRQKQLALSNKQLKQALNDEQMMTKIQNIEEECRSGVNEIEKQRNFLASKLNDEYREISDQLQLFGKIRSQLKIDVGAGRAALDILNNRFNEMKEIARQQVVESNSLMTCYHTCKSELTGRLEQLKGQNDAEHASHNEAKPKQEIMIKGRDAKTMELSEKIKGTEEEFCKLQSETDQFIKQCQNMKLSNEQELADFQQEMDSFEKGIKLDYDERFPPYDKKKCQQKEEMQTLENEICIRQEQVRNLTEANERFRKLQEQRKQKCAEGETIGSGGTKKLNSPGRAKMQSSENRAAKTESFDLDEIESYHYDNQMSLLSVPSNGILGQHFKKTKKK
uniref:Uncharacterized protein n=1 Tax=Anopheles atroparvus TaxID=41427 RepID=A0AAG5CWQ9_ANOAO